MDSSQHPVALITGGSSGLGLVVAQTFLDAGYRVMIVSRNQERIDRAIEQLAVSSDRLAGLSCDLANAGDVCRLFEQIGTQFGRLDVLINCAGGSDRGLAADLKVERLLELISQNVITALLCCQAAVPLLEKSGGVIVNVGSLAAKVGARYLGGYAAAKHSLAGLTQQLRLELRPRGIHVALVNPGPIRRDDEGSRYNDRVDDGVPDQATKPGAGTRVKGLPPQRVAQAILDCVRRKRVDVVLPGYLRILIAVGHAFPRLGDWLLLKFTSVKE